MIAQRLVRKLCPHCKEPHVADEAEAKLFSHLVEGEVTLHKAVGCDKCNYQGYKGRAGIYEYIQVDETIRKLIHDGANEQDIEEYARTSYPSIRDDGFSRVLAGETTLEEVLRVTAS